MIDKTMPHIPLPGEGKRGEEGHIGYLLRQAHAAVRLAVERALEDLEVTQPQFLVMTMINAYPGSSAADIARIAVLTPQTISLIVANLERAGRLKREQSPSHGRIQHMELTEEGKSLLARCRERTELIEERLVAQLDPDQERIIRRWLVDIATRPLNEGERSKVQGER
jgi:DNA-binding MarR family transcriptional regulator